MDNSYAGHFDIVTRLKKPMKIAFDLQPEEVENMSFLNAVMYSDTVFARHFDGLPLKYQFSTAELKDVFDINKWA